MARDRAAERAERRRLGYVGFVACSHGSGRLLKVALPAKLERVRAACPVQGCPDGEHVTRDAMSRPRRRGESCDAELMEPPPSDAPTTPVAPEPDPGAPSEGASTPCVEAHPCTPQPKRATSLYPDSAAQECGNHRQNPAVCRLQFVESVQRHRNTPRRPSSARSARLVGVEIEGRYTRRQP
jgi:hypothetical protein